MGWLVTAGILVLLAVLPLGVHIRYNSEGLLAKVIAGPVKITVFPLPKKEKKKAKEPVKEAAEGRKRRKPAGFPAAGEGGFGFFGGFPQKNPFKPSGTEAGSGRG